MTKIIVTANDIKRGVRGKGDTCPIAFAMRKHWPQAVVFNREFYRDPLELDFRPLPLTAITFIDDFDRGREVKPFAFEVK